jgi:hypothetical protein
VFSSGINTGGLVAILGGLLLPTQAASLALAPKPEPVPAE